jgi:hypothetical protein
MWVGDGGNNRALHLAADRSFIEKLMFLGNSYSCTVDANDSSRVFSDWKEFHVDWSKTLTMDPMDPGHWLKTGEQILPLSMQTSITGLSQLPHFQTVILMR